MTCQGVKYRNQFKAYSIALRDMYFELNLLISSTEIDFIVQICLSFVSGVDQSKISLKSICRIEISLNCLLPQMGMVLCRTAVKSVFRLKYLSDIFEILNYLFR